MPCDAMLCDAIMPCDAMLCDAIMPCHAMRCYAMRCDAMLCGDAMRRCGCGLPKLAHCAIRRHPWQPSICSRMHVCVTMSRSDDDGCDGDDDDDRGGGSVRWIGVNGVPHVHHLMMHNRVAPWSLTWGEEAASSSYRNGITRGALLRHMSTSSTPGLRSNSACMEDRCFPYTCSSICTHVPSLWGPFTLFLCHTSGFLMNVVTMLKVQGLMYPRAKKCIQSWTMWLNRWGTVSRSQTTVHSYFHLSWTFNQGR